MPRITCDVCQKSFSRAEHLKRHSHSHLQTKSFSCRYCMKKFVRKDAVQRHQRMHRGGRDQDLVIDPQYEQSQDCPLPGNGHAGGFRGGPSADPLSESTGDDSSRQGEFQGFPSLDRNRTTGSGVSSNEIRTSLHTNQTHHSEDVALPNLVASDANTAFEPVMSNDPTYMEAETRPPLRRFCSQMNMNLGSIQPASNQRTATSPQQSSPGGSNVVALSEARLDQACASNWLPFDYSQNSTLPAWTQDDQSPLERRYPHSQTTTTTNYLNPTDGMADPDSRYNNFAALITSMTTSISGAPELNGEDPNPVVDRVGATAWYAGGGGSRMSHTERGLLRRTTSRHPLDSLVHQVDSSGISWTSILHERAIRNLDCDGPRIIVPDSVRQEIISRTTLYDQHRTMSLIDKTILHDQDVLSYLIQLYFDNFHTAHPFLDRSLLCIPVWGWYLCLATAGVGARYASIDEATEFGDNLCAFVHQVLTQELGFDTTEDSLPHLQARVLSAVGMCHSRKSSLMNCGYSSLALICHSSLRLRLLNEDDRIGTLQEGQSLDQIWTAWKFREMRRRTGLFVWLFDATMAFVIGSPPKLPLSLLNLTLPSSEELWKAESHEQWFSTLGLARRSEWHAAAFHNEEKSRMGVRKAVKILRSRHEVPECMSDFTLSIMVQVLTRRHWDANQYLRDALDDTDMGVRPALGERLMQDAQMQYIGANPEHVKWRNSTCDCLDVLHRDALSVSARAMSHEGPSFLHLHLNRLFILVPLRPLFDYADSLIIMDQMLPHHLYASSEGDRDFFKIILIWLKRDRYKARLAIVHAGAIFWHLRRYPSDTFLEPFAVFLAALALWVFSKFHGMDSAESSHQTVSINEHESTNHVSSWDESQVNNTTIEGQKTMNMAMNQTKTSRGPRKPSLMVLDRPVDDELVQYFIRSGDSMLLLLEGVPDLCSKDGPYQVLQEAISMLNEYAEIWTASRCYRAFLKALAEA